MLGVRLASLKLTGFKSFVDPVTLEFPDPITAIVGPNGCGKSNIVDAILWVLGEQSPSLMRLKTMGDVVFSGTSKRKPAGAAEVVLTLAGADGRWEATGGELVVSRRVSRTGPSEYRLNGRSVRLKDVLDELLAVGLGTRAYSIIGQDRVGQVLSARPTDRRVLLEEAAGITRYKARKHEAELKLEQTRQNLARLDDVITEVDRTLRQLKRQARQAERYRKIEEGLTLRLRQLYTLQARTVEERRAALARERARIETELAAAASALGGAEADLAVARRELETARTEVEAARSEVARLATSRERLEAFLERSADLLDNLRSSIEANRGRLGSLAASRSSLEEEAAEAATRVAGLEEALAGVVARREEAALAEAGARERLEEAEARASALRQDLLKVISGVTAGRNQQLDLDRRLDRISYSLEQLDGELERAGARRTELEERFAAARTAAAEAARRADEARAHRDELSGRRSKLAEAAGVAGREAEALGHRLWEARHRLAGVERELARHAAAVDQVADLLPEESLAGQVSDALSPDPEIAPVLDLVWRDWLELPVVRLDELPGATLAMARELEARLRIVLAGPEMEPPEPLEVEGAEPLLPLAGISAGDAGWLLRVLPPAFRCPDGETARRLALEHPHALFLSPDGTLHRGAAVEPPTAGSRIHGALALGSEKERLGAEVARLEAEVERERGLQESLRTQMEELEAALAEASRALVEAEQERARTAAVEQSLGEELGRLEREMESLSAERERNLREREEATASRERLGREVEELERRVTETEAAVDAAVELVEGRRAEAAEALRELDHWKAEERLALERLETARAEAARVAQRRRELDERLATLDAESRELVERLERTEQEVVQSRARLVEEQGLLSGAREQERRLAGVVEEIAARVEKLEREVASRRSEHDAVRSRLHEQEVEEARLAAEREALEGAIASELGASLEELAAAEAPEDATAEELREAVEADRAKLEKMGPVNLLALQEVEELGERSRFLHEQRSDLVDSLTTLGETIREIDATCLERFVETFEKVNAVFAETFSHLFGGGTARLDLADEDDPLESGILITAQPPGKKNQSVQLLSGGEKALTALSLLIALFRIKPSPFCILDEVDAPLDDANVERLAELVRDMTEHTQFVLITHNRRTMTRADVLYGVTMEEPGVSKIVSVRMEDMV